jgi:hypothetical protein
MINVKNCMTKFIKGNQYNNLERKFIGHRKKYNHN